MVLKNAEFNINSQVIKAGFGISKWSEGGTFF